MDGYAFLIDGKIVEAHDLVAWSEWFADISNRHIGFMERDGVFVSTVFLGVDYGSGFGPSEWFETMICRDGQWDDFQERYGTLEEAIAGHSRACISTFGELAL